MENDNQFFTTYEDTEAWLKSKSIENYTINDDLTVDVNGDVIISNNELKCIPVQFGKVNGVADFSKNELTALKGSPSIVGASFYCNNNKLTTLQGCPREVNGEFYCNNNKLTSLEYAPETVIDNFICYNNDILNFDNNNFNVKKNIVFTYQDGMDHFLNDKMSWGDVDMLFTDFKKYNELNTLNKNLNSDLSIKSVKIKHKI